MTDPNAHSETDVSDDDFETIGDYHRIAAHHFSAAAKHHLAAAQADDEGDDEVAMRHAHLAYCHQLHGTQYAEVAAMESQDLDESLEASELNDAE